MQGVLRLPPPNPQRAQEEIPPLSQALCTIVLQQYATDISQDTDWTKSTANVRDLLNHEEGVMVMREEAPLDAEVIPSAAPTPKYPLFPDDLVTSFKHVLYNKLVEAHNNPQADHFVLPIAFQENGKLRCGFTFNAKHDRERTLAELYSYHIRKADLAKREKSCTFTQDLYRFYLRASLELLSKYFEKKDRFTFLYLNEPIFIPGEDLETAEARLRRMHSRTRRSKKKKKS